MFNFAVSRESLLSGFQWFFFIFCNTVVVPPTLLSAFQLPQSSLLTLTQYAFLATALACFAQAFCGHRRAIMEGPGGLWWGTILTITLGEGDVVVQPAVSYPTYEIGTQLAGATVVKVDDVTDVDSWVNIPNVKAIWINSPCNPSGEVISADWLTDIVAAARRIGAVVLSDECYALMDWRSVRRNTAASSAPAASASAASVPAAPVAESNEPASDTAFSLSATPCALNPHVCEGSAAGILVLYSLSKQSNMAGYRTALIAGDYRLVKEMAEYRKQIGQIIPGPVQAAMAAGLKDTAAVHEQWRRYRRRLSALVDALKAYGYSAQMPSGALYVWVKAKSGDCWADMAELAKIGIIPSPGEFYGAPAYLRFSATATDEAIRSACERLTA